MPQVPTNLFSVGAWLDGVTSTVALSNNAAYEIKGLRIHKDQHGQYIATIEPGGITVINKMAHRKGPGHVYIMQTIQYTSTDPENSCNFANAIRTWRTR